MKPTIESAFYAIMRSDIFRTDGPAIDLPAALQTLAGAVLAADTDESTWALGEYDECDLGSLIVAAYWCLTEWHAGQASPEYAALCALGRVFRPGPCSSGPEPESCEADAYEMLCGWFETRADAAAR